jgi:hypothetical protein
MTLERSEPASSFLLDDLRSDVGMEWIPEKMWLSYLSIDAPAGELDYDLAISANPGERADFADTGVAAPEVISVASGAIALWPIATGIGAGVVVLAILLSRRRRAMSLTGRLS